MTKPMMIHEIANAKVEEMVREIIRREGGFVDNPNDPGGATNFGVSLRYAQGIGLDLDGDGDTDAEDIRLVTPEVAAGLYVEDFFIRPKIHTLADPLQAPLFDFAVNAGAGRAIISLQHTCNLVAQVAPDLRLPTLVEDGGIGPKTRDVSTRLLSEMGSYFLNALVEERIAYYRHLAEVSSPKRVFLAGWIRRANEFRVEV